MTPPAYAVAPGQQGPRGGSTVDEVAAAGETREEQDVQPVDEQSQET